MNFSSLLCVALVSLVSARHDAAFVIHKPNARVSDSNMAMTSTKEFENENQSSRRQLLRQISLASIGFATGQVFQKQAAVASGGATAGGAYLLSAKQRYNSRVTQGIKSFLALGASLEGGSIVEASGFFESEEEGSWKDISTAGYLLANAFRRSSNTAPDSLPSVKAWKAFAKEMDLMQRGIKKKDPSSTLASFRKAEAALDGYLEEVELPPAIEMRK